MENGEQYREWTDVLEIIRKGLKEIKTHPKDEDPFKYPMPEPKVQALPKYKTDDIVYRPLENLLENTGNSALETIAMIWFPEKCRMFICMKTIGDTD
jgi:hypothetical protein